jgi:hypothetical protein
MNLAAPITVTHDLQNRRLQAASSTFAPIADFRARKWGARRVGGATTPTLGRITLNQPCRALQRRAIFTVQSPRPSPLSP